MYLEGTVKFNKESKLQNHIGLKNYSSNDK